MALENPQYLDNGRIMDNGFSFGDKLLQLHESNVHENENLGEDLLEGLDSYLEDINDRLIISRMVSDSVIKGMVGAIGQQASEMIAQKELELVGMKEVLRTCNVCSNNEFLGSSASHDNMAALAYRYQSALSKPLLQNDLDRDILSFSRHKAKEQFKNLRSEIDSIRYGKLGRIRKCISGSELVGLGGLLLENESERWSNIDKAIRNVENVIYPIFDQVEDIIDPKSDLFEVQQEWELQSEIKDMVITICIKGLFEDFNRNIEDLNSQFCHEESVDSKKIQEFLCLRQELEALTKLLSAPDSGQLISHKSLDADDEGANNKITDHIPRRLSGNHITSPWECNGKHEVVITMPENLDPGQLSHLKKDELIDYFKKEMIKMKRNHESDVQGMTEQFFKLRAEYLKEKRSLLPLKKEKDFDCLKRKIPEVILKLNDVIAETEKIMAFYGSFGSIKKRLEALITGNHQLQCVFDDKKNEVKCLSSQVSATSKEISRHSLREESLLEMIEKLESVMEGTHLEASLCEYVYQSLLQDAITNAACISRSDTAQLGLSGNHDGIVQNFKPAVKCEIDDVDMTYVLLQELTAFLYAEALKDAGEKASDLNDKYINEIKLNVLLKEDFMEKEKSLELKILESTELKQQTLQLTKYIEEKEKSTEQMRSILETKMEIAAKERDKLMDELTLKQKLISESRDEAEVAMRALSQARQVNESHQLELSRLNQELKTKMEELMRTSDEERRLLSLVQEKESSLYLGELKEREYKKQLEIINEALGSLLKVVDDLEERVTKDSKNYDSRLDALGSQVSSLIQKARMLRKTGSMYKQRLERRCTDLQKAEAEVDLLGDEVDTLLGLLEKIYIALDHYSPVLQHYPGIMEILKLVKTKLSGKLVRSV